MSRRTSWAPVPYTPTVSVDVKQHSTTKGRNGSPRLAHQADKRRQSSLDIIVSSASNYRRVQELCESRGGRLGLSVLMSLTVSVDVKEH